MTAIRPSSPHIPEAERRSFSQFLARVAQRRRFEGRSRAPRSGVTWLLGAALGMAGLAGACERSHSPSALPAKVPTVPTVRLYVASSIAGALEPCGCRKDMLGGVDHAAALLAQGKKQAPNSLVLGAGPMLFMNPQLSSERQTQDTWKAQSMAEAFAELKLAAWAPGANDFAAGQAELKKLVTKSGAKLLGANLETSTTPISQTQVYHEGGQLVGIAGVSEPTYRGMLPKDVKADDLEKGLQKALKELQAKGATIKVALVAAGRGEALRLAEKVPGFQVFIVGKSSDSGEANDAPIPPVLVGDTLVVQSPNHLQALGIVDLYVRGETKSFADASGIEAKEQTQSLKRRISELSTRIQGWEKDGKVAKADLDARKADLSRLRKELSEVKGGKVPARGSFFKYTLSEVRETNGKDEQVYARMLDYYKRVNEQNKALFKDRKPKPVEKGQPHYVGVKKCAECHEEAYEFWKKTGHGSAYKTLTDEFKEFNLDCVSCHVTGYERPGGSTVTHVEGLKDVQCETCHGPGSQHVKTEDLEFITLKPATSVCRKCHHAPHVADDWSPKVAWPHIVGPGHGEDSEP